MALWFKKKPINERVLEFNQTKLKTELQNLSSRLSVLKDDLGVAVIEEVIQLARNIQILESNKYRDEKNFFIHHGRVQALSDLADYISRSKEVKEEKKKEGVPRDQLKSVKQRRTDHQAGIAI